MNYTMVMGDKNMAKIEQCPGFETFGADVKAAREKLGMSRRELADRGRSPLSGEHRIKVNDPKYAADGAAIPPVQPPGRKVF